MFCHQSRKKNLLTSFCLSEAEHLNPEKSASTEGAGRRLLSPALVPHMLIYTEASIHMRCCRGQRRHQQACRAGRWLMSLSGNRGSVPRLISQCQGGGAHVRPPGSQPASPVHLGGMSSPTGRVPGSEAHALARVGGTSAPPNDDQQPPSGRRSAGRC